jgi:hypothetical protein
LDLIVLNGTDLDNDPLNYYFELDQAPEFNSPNVQRSGPVAEAQMQTSWHVSGLSENTWYYWRVKASDGLAESDWIQGSFFVNQHNEAPSTPTLHNPGNQAWVGTLNPALELNSSKDPDLDDLSCSFQVYADKDLSQLIASGTTKAQEDGTVAWPVPQILQNHHWYYWRAMALDEHGLTSAGTDLNSFFVYREFNEPPSITLIEPNKDYVSNGRAVKIRWIDNDPDNNARISLYYDTAASGGNGHLIVSGIEEDPDGEA